MSPTSRVTMETIESGGVAGTRAVLLKDGFDASWFNDGQHAIPM
ncbi:MAG: hypothetical protein ACTHL8_11585 [Burkholderiaceae bacterium]